MKFPLPEKMLSAILHNIGIDDISKASIRQTGEIGRCLEHDSGVEFLHLEMGVPGLEAEKIGIEAERAALSSGVASVYPNMYGIPSLKQEASRFIEAFLGVEVPPQGCVPTVGSMQGTFAALTPPPGGLV